MQIGLGLPFNTPPRGIVKNGLVAWYDFAKRNLLKYSEDFSNSIWAKTNFTVSNSIDLLETVTDGAHVAQQVVTSETGKQYVRTLKIRPLGGRKRFAVTLHGISYYAVFDTDTVSVVETSNAVASIVKDGNDYILSVSATISTTSAQLNLYSIPDNGLFANRSFIGDPLKGIKVYWQQFEFGNQATGYEKTTDNQTLLDKSLNANHGTLGSTTGADTNDPTWNGQGLSFGGDDYVKLPYMINAQQDFTVYLVANIGTTVPSSDETYLSMGNSNTAVQFLYMRRKTNGTIGMYATNDAGDTTLTGSMTSIPGVRMFKLQRKNSILILRDIEANTQTNVEMPANPLTLNQISLGTLLRSSSVYYLNQPMYLAIFYNRATTDSEDTYVYNVIKRTLAQRGVVLP